MTKRCAARATGRVAFRVAAAAIVAAAGSVSAALAIGGVLAEHIGWTAYFAFGGIFTIFACFVFYMLFDKNEAIVEERDRLEALARNKP